MSKVIHRELVCLSLNDANVIPELFVGNQVVSVSIHFVECLHNIDDFNAGSNERLFNLISLQAAELGTL